MCDKCNKEPSTPPKEPTQKDAFPSAKNLSLVSQIVAAIWVALWSSFKFIAACKTGQLSNIDIKDIIISAFALAGCFCPVYVSIILDKIFTKLQ